MSAELPDFPYERDQSALASQPEISALYESLYKSLIARGRCILVNESRVALRLDLACGFDGRQLAALMEIPAFEGAEENIDGLIQIISLHTEVEGDELRGRGARVIGTISGQDYQYPDQLVFDPRGRTFREGRENNLYDLEMLALMSCRLGLDAAANLTPESVDKKVGNGVFDTPQWLDTLMSAADRVMATRLGGLLLARHRPHSGDAIM